jgi:predicted permease
MEILIFIIIYAAFFYGIFKLAKSKNREPGGWMLTSIIVSPLIILIILAVMQALPGKKRASVKKRKVSKKAK